MEKSLTFKKAEDDEYLLNRYTATEADGRVIEVGIGPMLYGFRIRAGYVGDMVYYIDWCCGADNALVYLTQGLVMGLLTKGYKMHELPGYSKIKPWNKDKEFQDIVWKLTETLPKNHGNKSETP